MDWFLCDGDLRHEKVTTPVVHNYLRIRFVMLEMSN